MMRRTLGAVVVGTSVMSLALASAAAADPLLGSARARVSHASGPVAAKAGTSVTIGQVNGTPTDCGFAVTAVQSASVGVSYAVPGTPAKSVITSYSYNSGSVPGSVRLAAFVPGLGTNWTLVGKSPLAPVTLFVVNTFQVRVPVPAGAHLGMQITSDSMDCGATTGSGGDILAFSTTFNPDVATDMAVTQVAGVHANISAVVESDADGDGYGDVTQDLCPESALTQATCPAPDTKITKAPAKRSTKRKAKITFNATVAGSTFTCAVDGKAAVPCTSPFTKKYKYGKHRVVITALLGGTADPTPATVRFKVIRP